MKKRIIWRDLEQGTAEWLEARRGLITASVIGKLITEKTLKPAKNDTARGTLMQLAAERISGQVDDGFVSFDMQRGIDHEPYARRAYEANHSDVEQVGFITLETSAYKIGYSPDGLVGDHGLIEIKCPRAKTHVATILAGRVPSSHMAQLQTGLFATGREWIDYISFCGGLPLFVKRVEPIGQWQTVIAEVAETAEKTIRELVADYETKTAGMPKTEPVPNLDELELL